MASCRLCRGGFSRTGLAGRDLAILRQQGFVWVPLVVLGYGALREFCSGEIKVQASLCRAGDQFILRKKRQPCTGGDTFICGGHSTSTHVFAAGLQRWSRGAWWRGYHHKNNTLQRQETFLLWLASKWEGAWSRIRKLRRPEMKSVSEMRTKERVCVPCPW